MPPLLARLPLDLPVLLAALVLPGAQAVAAAEWPGAAGASQIDRQPLGAPVAGTPVLAWVPVGPPSMPIICW
jgi:hypothetical protein